MFAVTADLGADELAKGFEKNLHGYNAILVKAIADRLAEALAQARKDWGYEKETPSNADLVAEKYRGIRPAYRYPACPDHSEKFKLFDLLDARRQGITQTEHGAMWPAAYFNVGRIGRDQLEDYPRRKGEALEVTERWLASNLAYEPAEFGVKC